MRYAFMIVALLLASAPCFAQLELQDVIDKPRQDVEQALPASHPSNYYAYATRLFHDGSKDDAVFWFYVGQIRYRFYLSAHPNLGFYPVSAAS